MAKSRVEIPRNAEELLGLADKVNKKHIADAANSPLRPLAWPAIGPTIAQALVFHEQAEALRRQMEAAYQQRDKLMKPIEDIVKSSRDILTGAYQKEMKKLGDWGFSVADSGGPSGRKAGNGGAKT
jgi:hypothetical protein